MPWQLSSDRTRPLSMAAKPTTSGAHWQSKSDVSPKVSSQSSDSLAVQLSDSSSHAATHLRPLRRQKSRHEWCFMPLASTLQLSEEHLFLMSGIPLQPCSPVTAGP